MKPPGDTVLVVEDEALIRFTIADDLREAGYRVIEAQDADEAIRILETDGDVRLVFTDIDMPGSMDGLRLSAVIRDRWPPVRIIVTSGKASPTQSALPSGSRFLTKPYTRAGVLGAMREMLASG
jgi:CheY-like chemotaxis protein